VAEELAFEADARGWRRSSLAGRCAVALVAEVMDGAGQRRSLPTPPLRRDEHVLLVGATRWTSFMTSRIAAERRSGCAKSSTGAGDLAAQELILQGDLAVAQQVIDLVAARRRR